MRGPTEERRIRRGAVARSRGGWDDPIVKKRAQYGTLASGGDDAIIPNRRKGDDITRDATVITSLRDLPLQSTPMVQHRNVVPCGRAPSMEWARGVVLCSGDAAGTDTGLQDRATQRSAGPALHLLMARGPSQEVDPTKRRLLNYLERRLTD